MSLNNTSGQARRALNLFCRPNIECRAVSHPYHIQLLLGHADLRVTFERYVHLVDLAMADAVQTAEYRSGAEEHLSPAIAAQLVGVSKKTLRERFRAADDQFKLADVERLLRNDVGRFA